MEEPPRLRKQPGGMAQGKELPMRRDCTVIPPFESIPTRNGIVVLSGYGLVVRVERGRLLLKDGVARTRRQSRFTKATCGIKRMVILGHTGIISLEAIRWLHDIGAAIIQIDADGQILLTSAPFKETHPRLRRAQALALNEDLGTVIIQRLLDEKLNGQAQLVEDMGIANKAELIHKLRNDLHVIKKPQNLLQLEAKAAIIYWDVWSNLEVTFARQDRKAIPPYWRRFNQRISHLTSSPRNASNPVNAMLNYLYAILEAETRIACLTVGLDPGMGFLHSDQKNRDSLALDIMEPIRPIVDRWLVSFLKENCFKKKDFFERRDGSVRISSRITSLLAETSPIWRNAIAPVTEWVASTLSRGSVVKGSILEGQRRLDVPTRLTEANRSIGRTKYRKKTKSKSIPKTTIRTCPDCGEVVKNRDREFCSTECWEKFNNEIVLPRLTKAGPRKMAEKRVSGKDPSHGGDVGIQRGRSNAKRVRQRVKWEKQNQGVDIQAEKVRFSKEILPKLKSIPLRQLAKGSGLSLRYSSLIRRGEYTPHPMHYEKLEELILLYNEIDGG